jgi:hypothetical protein
VLEDGGEFLLEGVIEQLMPDAAQSELNSVEPVFEEIRSRGS